MPRPIRLAIVILVVALLAACGPTNAASLQPILGGNWRAVDRPDDTLSLDFTTGHYSGTTAGQPFELSFTMTDSTDSSAKIQLSDDTTAVVEAQPGGRLRVARDAPGAQPTLYQR
jgi:hypothetical protein